VLGLAQVKQVGSKSEDVGGVLIQVTFEEAPWLLKEAIEHSSEYFCIQTGPSSCFRRGSRTRLQHRLTASILSRCVCANCS